LRPSMTYTSVVLCAYVGRLRYTLYCSAVSLYNNAREEDERSILYTVHLKWGVIDPVDSW
jgi:hypothetical protein